MSREEFYANINKKTENRKDFTLEKLQRYIEIFLNENITKKSQEYYYVKRKYAIKKNRDRWVLIDRKNVNDDTPPHYVHLGEIYDIINIAHKTAFHGGERKTLQSVRQHAINIKHYHVKSFIASCPTCQKNKNANKKESKGFKRIQTFEFGVRGQVDLINVKKLRAQNNDDYRYILNYQDNFSKFCMLRGLMDKKPSSIIEALKEIFTTIGAPRIIQTDNGGEFVNKDFKTYLQTHWPCIQQHIRGSPYHPQSQGSVERANGHVKSMLKKYLFDNKNCTIKYILPILQYQKNIWENRTIKMSPYKAVFGKDAPRNE